MSNQPNIVFITAHDIGRHLGCYGVGAESMMPCLDQLAATGVRCENAFCASPLCSPARAALVTGRYPHSNGVQGLVHAPFHWDLSQGEVHLATRLKQAGYITALAGLQHETSDAAAHGLDQLLTGGRGKASVVADACEKFLETHTQGREPFYLQVGFFEPHRNRGNGFGPYTPEPVESVTIPRWLRDDQGARQEMACFQAAARAMDQAVGRIMAALDRQGLSQNTLILFAADHGLPFPRAKGSLYDPGLEIAMIARWPKGGIAGGRVCSTLIGGVDVTPTLLELVGDSSPHRFQGRSVAAAWRGEALSPSPIFAENNFHAYWDPMRCVRTLDAKLIVNFAVTPAFYDTSQQWRPLTTPRVPEDPRNAKHPLVELYDLVADPLEERNLADAADRVEQRQHLLRLLAQWMRQTADPLLTMPSLEPRFTVARSLIESALT